MSDGRPAITTFDVGEAATRGDDYLGGDANTLANSYFYGSDGS